MKMTRVGLEPTTSRFDLWNATTAQPGLRKTQAISFTQIVASPLIKCRDEPIRALCHYTGPAEGRRLSHTRETIAVPSLDTVAGSKLEEKQDLENQSR